MKPLEGIRILTVEHFGAGPYGTMFLAGLGAEVIKVENAASGGDTSRHVGPHFLGEDDSVYFQCLNLWKKSVSLDLSRDKEKFQTLIWLNTVKGRATARRFHISARCIDQRPDGQRGVVEVTTVDQADMRALASLKTVVRHGAASL